MGGRVLGVLSGIALLAGCAAGSDVVNAPRVALAPLATPSAAPVVARPAPGPPIAVESTSLPVVEPEVQIPAPTWSQLFERYFALGTDGSCGRSGKCHGAPMGDAQSAYTWLRQRGYIDGERSAIASTTNSCLRWFGGNMPPSPKAPANPQALAEMRAWVAAGAADN